MSGDVAVVKRDARASEVPRPNLRAVHYRHASGTTVVVFEVPVGVVTRRAVELRGVPRYSRNGTGKWRPWEDVTPTWASSWGRAAQLNGVPVADPDPAVEPQPGAFVVGASTWCSWPVHVREALRAVTTWMKGPGVMRTELVDGVTAERLRDVAYQFGVAGLEETDGSPVTT